MKCHVEPLTSESFDRVEMGDLDFCMTANDWRLYGHKRFGRQIRTEPMFRDDFVCVVDAKFVEVDVAMTLDSYRTHRHNSVVFGNGIATIVERAWAASVFEIEVAVTVPTFSALILMLPGTSLVATAQRKLAVSLAPALGLAIAECPLPIPLLDENIFWHERNETDPRHLFLRDMLRRTAADVDGALPLSHKRHL